MQTFLTVGLKSESKALILLLTSLSGGALSRQKRKILHVFSYPLHHLPQDQPKLQEPHVVKSSLFTI